jgi:hypothetical protein
LQIGDCVRRSLGEGGLQILDLKEKDRNADKSAFLPFNEFLETGLIFFFHLFS